MSSPETPAPRDVQQYISEVDDLLLDIPWQRRRELIAGLREHLQANPEQIHAEQPHEYAAELRDTTAPATAGLLSGLRSMSWPTPLEWWESVIRGMALMLLAWVAWDFLAAASQPLFGDPSPTSWSAMLDAAFGSIYPTPTLRGSHRDGLPAFIILAVLVGQLTTAAALRRMPRRRSVLRTLTYVSIAVIIALLGYAAAQHAG